MVESMVSNRQISEEKKHKESLVDRYAAFCKGQENQGMIWFLIPLMTLPAAIMPISIFAMSYFTGYIAFIGISILLFFTNIVLTIAEQPIKTRITFYLATVLFHVGVPLIAFLFGLLSG